MKLKQILTLIVLGTCGGTIYALPYLKYYFYNQMTANMGVTGQDLGFLITVLAVVGMILLLPGGILADRLSNKKCIFWSLISTAVLAVIYAFTYASYTICLVIWFLLAFSTTVLAWPAIMKTVRAVGEDRAGTAYSIYYASNGITASIVGYLIISTYSFIATDDVATHRPAFFWSIIILAVALTLSGFLLIYFLRGVKKTESSGEAAKIPTLKDSYTVIKMPIIWIITITLFCTYSIYIGMTFFTPYLTSAFGVSDETSGTLSIIRTNFFMALTPLTGIIADRLMKSTLKWFTVACPIVIVCIAAVLLIGNNVNMAIPVMILSMIAAFFVCSIYASMYSIMAECKIPMAIAGTAIGLVSMFASSMPDVVIQPLFGYFVDKNQYPLIFMILIGMTIVSMLLCFVLLRKNKHTPVEEPCAQKS